MNKLKLNIKRKTLLMNDGFTVFILFIRDFRVAQPALGVLLRTAIIVSGSEIESGLI